MITVENLIELLQAYPEQKAPIALLGYETGFTGLFALETIRLENSEDPNWYAGEWKKVDLGGVPCCFLSPLRDRNDRPQKEIAKLREPWQVSKP